MDKEISKMSILKAQKKHIDGMTCCHMKSFPGEFMALIGKRFVKGFYRFYIASHNSIVFVAVNESGKVVGLVAGGMPELRKRFTVTRVPLYVFDILLSAILNSNCRTRFLQHVSSMLKKVLIKLHLASAGAIVEEPPADRIGTWSSLLSVCILPDYCGRGIASCLMEEFRQQSKTMGYETIRLSVHLDNEPAIALYKKCGWQEIFRNVRGIYFKRNVKD